MGRYPASATSVLLAVVFAACVGNDPGSGNANTIATPDGGSSGGPGADGGGNGPTCRGDEPTACGASCTPCKAPKDGRATCTNGVCGLECDAPATPCGDACVALAGSPEHCGKCGHSCGGGVCLQNVCQPTLVVQGLVAPVAFDVGPSSIIVSTQPALVSCDLPAGCGNAAPKKLAEAYKSMGEVAISGTEVFWIGGSQGDSDTIWLRRCPIAGCPQTPMQIQSDTNATIEHLRASGTTLVWRRLSGGENVFSCALPTCTPQTIAPAVDATSLATDGASVFFMRPILNAPDEIYRCAVGATCPTPTKITDGRVDGALAVHKGVLYIADKGQASGINDGYIRTASAGAAGPTATFAREEIGPVDIAVDDDGAYWVNTDQKTVKTCSLSGCTGAPRELATQQTGVKQVRSDAKFVYWLTGDSVYKVAK